jgi:hypothetical protein
MRMECVVVSTSEVRRRPQNLLVGEKEFEDVSKFTYVGAVINNSNDMGQNITGYKPGTRHTMLTYIYLKTNLLAEVQIFEDL